MGTKELQELRREVAAQAQQLEVLACLLRDRLPVLASAPVPVCDLTWSRLLDLYVSRHRHEKWAAQLRYKIKVFMTHFGERRVMECSRADWYHWRDEIRAKTTTRMKRLPAVGTLNQDLFRVRPMLKWAVSEKLLPSNPWDGIAKLKGERSRVTEISVPALMERLKTAPRLPSVFLVLSVEAGMRRNEIRLMGWSEIDLETGRHSIPPASAGHASPNRTEDKDAA